MVSLADALAAFEFEEGRRYRVNVRGRTVELFVVDDAPTPALANQVMLEPWVVLPFDAIGTITVRPGNVRLPDPPVIPDDSEWQP